MVARYERGGEPMPKGEAHSQQHVNAPQWMGGLRDRSGEGGGGSTHVNTY